MFSEIIQRGHTCFLENAALIRHSSFPRILLPVMTTLSAMLNFSILFALYLVVLALTGQHLSVHLLALVPLILLLGGLAFSATVALALVNVYARDISQAVPFGLQLLSGSRLSSIRNRDAGIACQLLAVESLERRHRRHATRRRLESMAGVATPGLSGAVSGPRAIAEPHSVRRVAGTLADEL